MRDRQATLTRRPVRIDRVDHANLDVGVFLGQLHEELVQGFPVRGGPFLLPKIAQDVQRDPAFRIGLDDFLSFFDAREDRHMQGSRVQVPLRAIAGGHELREITPLPGGFEVGIVLRGVLVAIYLVKVLAQIVDGIFVVQFGVGLGLIAGVQ